MHDKNDSITYTEEKWSKCVEELKLYFPQHYQELAVETGDVLPRVMWWNKYEALEQADILLVMAVRDEGKLIGYTIGLIQPHLHYATTPHYFSDLYYLDHKYRRRGIGSQMFVELEKILVSKGVQKMFFNTKIHEHHGEVFLKNGFKHTDDTFAKLIG